VGKRFNKGDRAGWKFVGSGSRRGTENVAGNLAQPPLSTPENLNGDLHGTGFLSVDSPRLVNDLGGGGCELVSFRDAPACASELVETARLALHYGGILTPGGVLGRGVSFASDLFGVGSSTNGNAKSDGEEMNE
jgi:hypothetical protein